ncbi:MAG: hypothetical protein OEL66_09465 [Desulfobulbaceae bacterium]|nr:hypothetical protein [Desulfobulbaceae bacterium]
MMHQKPQTVSPFVISLFFVIGLVSAFSFRVLIVFVYLKPEWFRPTWYVGIVGYTIFFLYRYRISQKRKKAVAEYNLIEKLEQETTLLSDDRQVLIYLLSSIRKSRENINYLFIFVLSLLAVVLDIFLAGRGV